MKIDCINQFNKAIKHMPIEIIDECIIFLMNRELNIYSYGSDIDNFAKFKTTLTYLRAIKPRNLGLLVRLLKAAKLEIIKTIEFSNNEVSNGDIVLRPNHESVFCPKLMNINYHRTNGNILGIVN